MMKRKPEKRSKDPVYEKIAAACQLVYRELGPGFNQRIYLNALKIALQKFKLVISSDDEFWVAFDREIIGRIRIDIVVENKVLVQIKIMEGKMPKVFEEHMISYLRATNVKTGVLVNFGALKCEVRKIFLP